MDQVPVELAIKILSLACFDDKNAGRALCLTSRWIREISNNVRFEALSLYGLAQISGFATMLEHLPLGQVELKHLFISGTNLDEENKARDRRGTHAQGVEINRTAIAGEPTALRQWTQAADGQTSIEDPFATIVRCTGSTLKTLFITSVRDTKSLLSQSLPQLADLSVTSSGGLFELGHCFPNLRRIHTTALPWYSNTSKYINYAEYTPMLEELRLTDQRRSAMWFVAELTLSLCGSHRKRLKDPELLFPASMQRIILQQGPPPYGLQPERHWHHYKNSCETLCKNVESFRASPEAKFQVVVLHALDEEFWASGRSSGLGYFFDDARRDWVDVISGTGKGCWDDRDALYG